MKYSANATTSLAVLLFAACLPFSPQALADDATVPVNADNFAQAETAIQFDRFLETYLAGKINTWGHNRTPPPIDNQTVIRMNRDTLYSAIVVDISKGATLSIPETANRYMSIMVVNEDHYINKVFHDAGTYDLTMDEFHTPYVMLSARTLVNASDPADVKKVHALQDQLMIKATSARPYPHPNYDQVSYKATYDALIELSRGMTDAKRSFGKKEDVSEMRHIIGAAFGWGGLPEHEANYLNVEPNLPVGAYQLTVKDVPVDAFWSISVYNKDGFFDENEFDAYSVNNISGTPNKDGSFTVHFGGDPTSVNHLPIMEGWNYIVRLYQPRDEILDGTWVFPSVKEVDHRTFDAQVDAYIRLFPYQDTFNYARQYTGGDPGNVNVWVPGSEPVLIRAGDDTVVRTNNDTFYKAAFLMLKEGPVYLRSDAPAQDRFNSFQLMDDRNVNYRNVIYPSGEYTLFHGAKPADIHGEAIEVPSELSVIPVRVEVKDKHDQRDIAAATAVFDGIKIDGAPPAAFPVVDLLATFSDDVAAAANLKMDEAAQSLPFREMIVGPGQAPGRDVSFLNHAAGTKSGWGGPATSHSSYEGHFFDINGNEMHGRNGPYTVTTEEPMVAAFWSMTVYDTDRGGFLHPNDDDRYHINNTGAVINDDATITFLFKRSCMPSDVNCLEVPAGRFDVFARYYLPDAAIQTGDWTMPKIEKVD